MGSGKSGDGRNSHVAVRPRAFLPEGRVPLPGQVSPSRSLARHSSLRRGVFGCSPAFGDAVSDADPLDLIVADGEPGAGFEVAQMPARLAVKHNGAAIRQVEFLRAEQRLDL